MLRRTASRLAGSASAMAMTVAMAAAPMGALLTSSVVEAQQAQPQDAQAAPVPPQGTILSPIVIKTPRNAGPSAPLSQPSPAATAPTAPAATPSSFDALSTISEKSAATVYDLPGTVTVKSTAEMERQNINNAREFVRDEPGLSVGNQPGRTGATNFVIRGIGENRVRLEIDGVKVPDFPGTNIGAGTYTRDFIDYESLKRIEIVRGPASALYGSDALGGVVAFITKDPSDYLDLVKKDWYVSLKGGFDSLDSSVYSTVTGASRVGASRVPRRGDAPLGPRGRHQQPYARREPAGLHDQQRARQSRLQHLRRRPDQADGRVLRQARRDPAQLRERCVPRPVRARLQRRGRRHHLSPARQRGLDPAGQLVGGRCPQDQALRHQRAPRGVHRSAEGLLLRRSAAATRDAAAADGPLLRPGHRRRRGAGDRSPQVLGCRPLLHLRRDG